MRCLPSEKRAKPSPEWNHYRVTCRDGVLKLEVNGKEVSGGSDCVAAEGLHLPGGRRLGVPLPQPPDQGDARHADATPAETAALDQGFVSLYSGLDLRGWKSDPGHAGHWRAKDFDPRLRRQEHGQGQGPLDREGVRRLRPDRRLAAPRQANAAPPAGRAPQRRRRQEPRRQGARRSRSPTPATAASCSAAQDKGQVNITCNTIGSGELYGYRVDKTMPPEVRSGVDPQGQGRRPARQVEPVRHHPEEGPRDGRPQRPDGDRQEPSSRASPPAARSASSTTATRCSSRTCSSRSCGKAQGPSSTPAEIARPSGPRSHPGLP